MERTTGSYHGGEFAEAGRRAAADPGAEVDRRAEITRLRARIARMGGAASSASSLSSSTGASGPSLLREAGGVVASDDALMSWPDAFAVLGRVVGESGRVLQVETEAGRGALALQAALVSQMVQRGLVAWVDGRGDLYPPSLEASGVDLTRVLVVRVSRGSSALRAAELLLASGALGGLVVDLPAGVPSPSGWPARARRLVARARGSGSPVIWSVEGRAFRLPVPVDARARFAPPGERDALSLRSYWELELRGGVRSWVRLPRRTPSAATSLYLARSGEEGERFE